jgi:hypothetical protein
MMADLQTDIQERILRQDFIFPKNYLKKSSWNVHLMWNI